jgi:glycosyltransferase involved in cell wall biosynthesis
VRVLLAAHGGNLTGAERDVLELALALQGRDGTDVGVVVPAAGALLDTLRENSVAVSVAPYRWWVSERAVVPRLAAFLARYPRSADRAAALLERLRPDVVVTFTLAVPVWAAAARRVGVPHVWMAREFVVEDHGLHFLLGRKRSMQFVDRSSELVGVPSHAVAERLSEWIPRPKLRVIRYAALQERATPDVAKRTASFELLSVGTLRSSKGQHEAIEVLARLREAGVPAELTLVGSGRAGDIARLQRLARTLGVAGAVSFVGSVADPTPFYDAADVLVLCSRSEAYGRVVVEAMKRGVPVVATRSGGSVEQIDDSQGGLLYEPGDIDGLATAVRRLFDDADLRRRLGANGRAWATAAFTLERYGDDFMALAEEAVRSRPSRETA